MTIRPRANGDLLEKLPAPQFGKLAERRALAATPPPVPPARAADRLMTAVAQALKVLLGPGDFDGAVHEALGILGPPAGLHRVKVIRQRTEAASGKLIHELAQEWWAPELRSQASYGFTRFEDSNAGEYLAPLKAGQSLWQSIDEVVGPLREPWQRAGILSMGMVPIFAGNRYAGTVEFDDCRERRIWSPGEIDVLTVAARAIGVAIHGRELEKAAELRVGELGKANEALRRRDALLRAVGEAARRLGEESDLRTGIHRAMAAVGELAAVDRVCFLVYHDEECRWHFEGEWLAPGVRSNWPEFGGAGLADADFAEVVVPLQAGQAYTSKQSARTGRNAEINAASGSLSDLILPIFVAGKLWGCIALDDCTRERDWLEAEIEALRGVAEAISSAVRRAQLEREKAEAIATEREAAVELRAAELARANEVIQRSLARLTRGDDSLPKFLSDVLAEVARVAEASLGAVLLTSPDMRFLAMHAAIADGVPLDTGLDARLAAWVNPQPVTDFPGWNALEQQEITWNHPLDAPEIPGSGRGSWHRETGHRTVLYAPIHVGEQLVGLFALSWRQATALSAQKLELIRALANHAALAIHLRRLSDDNEATAVLEERNRIARDIHDSLAQSFTGILMQLQAAARYTEKNQQLALACADRAQDLARDGLREARQSVNALSPLSAKSEDLAGAVQRLAEQATTDTAAPSTVTMQGKARPVPAVIAANLLMICREALGNAQRYAHAKSIEIDLAFEPQYLGLRVTDDGCGFAATEVNGAGFGLASMRARAERMGGTFSIQSAAGAGTMVQVRVPTAADVATSSC